MYLLTTSRESTKFFWSGVRRSYAPTVLANRVSPPFFGFCSMYRDTHSGGTCTTAHQTLMGACTEIYGREWWSQA